MEISILEMYARCLQRLEKVDEYVNIALKLLSKVVYSKLQDGSGRGYQGRADDDGSGYLFNVIAASRLLNAPTTTPMDQCFTDIHVNPYLRHIKDRDGFELRLTLRHHLPDELSAQEVKVKLLNTAEGPTREIWLCAPGPVKVARGLVNIRVTTNVLFPPGNWRVAC